MSGERIANDVHTSLIMMWQALQNGWIPPKEVSEQEHKEAKKMSDCALKAFAGFGCSFGGKYFGGYARNSIKNNYALSAHNSCLRKKKLFKDVTFFNKSYLDFTPKNQLIYCDPPYKDTSRYNTTAKFDSALFWATMREWSKDNLVFISEYQAPEDFKRVWQKEKKLSIRSKNGCEIRVERLFVHRSQQEVLVSQCELF